MKHILKLPTQVIDVQNEEHVDCVGFVDISDGVEVKPQLRIEHRQQGHTAENGDQKDDADDVHLTEHSHENRVKINMLCFTANIINQRTDISNNKINY